MKDDASGSLKALDAKFRASGASSGKGFSDGFSQASKGLLGGIFGHGSSSAMSDAQAQGRNIGTGLARGITQKFSQSMGSGLLGGLFGTSGGNKLFGSAGASVVQDAEKQGASIAEGLSRGLTNGLGKTKQGLGGLLGGMMPGIGGLSGMQATIGGLGGSLLGMLPAVAAVGAGIGTIGSGLSVISLGAKQLIGSKNTKQNPNAEGPLFQQAQAAQKALQDMMQTAAGAMLQPLKQAFSALPGLIKQVTPAMTAMFSGAGSMIMPLVNGIANLAKQVLPLLGGAFRAAAPLITPLLNGIAKLATGLLPGLISLLKAAKPAFDALSSILGTLGKDVGGMLSSFAPVISSASIIFKALGDVIAAIFPIVGKLAAVFASALAPAFVQVAGLVKALLPILGVIANVIAQFAGAVLSDLIGVLGTVVTLLKDLSPSFTILAKALGQVFSVMENSGVFAIMGDALENLAPLIAKLINTLVQGLAPVFPILIQAVSQLATALVSMLSAGLGTLLQVLTPVIALIAQLITNLVLWLQKNQLLLPVLAAIAIAINPVGAAVIALIAVIGVLSQHWQQIWTDIKNWTNDAVNFIKGLFNALPAPLREALTAMFNVWKLEWSAIQTVGKTIWDAIALYFKIAWDALVAAFKVVGDLLTGNWRGALNAIKTAGEQIWNAIQAYLGQVWNNIKGLASAAGNAIENIFGGAWNSVKSTTMSVWNSISGFFSTIWKDLKSGFNDVVSGIGSAWNRLEGVFKAPVNFLINTVYMGGIRRLWDDVMNAIGLGSLDLPPVSGLATGGKLDGFGGGDSVLAMLEPGEAVVDKNRTRQYAPLLKAMGVPGFTSGGIVGNLENYAKMALAVVTGNPIAFANAMAGSALGGNGGAGGELASAIVTLPGQMLDNAVKGIWHKIVQFWNKATTPTTGNESGGPGGGAPGANAALARKLHPDWGGGPFWSAWNSVAMRESGWNQFAMNPGSGAYGIPQALPYTKMPKAAWPASAGGSSNPTAQINWMYDYIRSVYGNPVNAWAHELSAGWYDHGGWLKPGWNLAYNGTGMPEPVGPAAGGGGVVQLEVSASGQTAFEQFMITALRNWVRIKGGGNVQTAFGRT